ncbi:hypothetical protein GCM10009830_00050 [Glycomyces endophyticus]|uniref:Branched-chain-amino-acid aminotransferase n=1 Tax=Glycomyces endophyticus TaxID=480996 RepID=A0ABN2FTC4_9ACTN
MSFEDRDGRIWLDGRLVPWRDARLHVLSHGLHYGGAVFEGERAYGGRVFRLRAHTERLRASAAAMGMDLPFTDAEIDAATAEVLAANGIGDGYVRPVVWRGGEQLSVSGEGNRVHVAIAPWEWPAVFDGDAKRRGLDLAVSSRRRPHPAAFPVTAKCAALYSAGTLARAEAEARGCDDALLLDHRGDLADATGANVFLRFGDELHTPEPGAMLAGITRAAVIGLAGEAGIAVVERRIAPEEVADADEVFLTGTAYEVQPVRSVDGAVFPVGEWTLALMDRYAALVREGAGAPAAVPEAGPPTVALLGGKLNLVERVRALGCRTVVFERPELIAPEVVAAADHVVLGDYADLDRTCAILRAFADDPGGLRVLSYTEPGMLPVAEVNARLGLEDNDIATVMTTVDKTLMRRLLDDEPRFAVVHAIVCDWDGVDAFQAAHGDAVIVKPVDGGGSIGVVRLRRRHSPGDRPELPPFPLLAERFLEGREFSVEGIAAHGKHTVVGVTEKFLHPNGPVEMGHRFPAAIDEADRAAIAAYTDEFLALVGVEHGLTHTEVILTADGPRIVETHTRHGGDHITDLVRISTGYDLLDAAVRARCGLPFTADAPPPARTAVIRYLDAPPGVVRRVSGVETARYLPGVQEVRVDVALGSRVREVRSSLDRVGHVVAAAEDAETADRIAREALEAVVIETDGG